MKHICLLILFTISIAKFVEPLLTDIGIKFDGKTSNSFANSRKNNTCFSCVQFQI